MTSRGKRRRCSCTGAGWTQFTQPFHSAKFRASSSQFSILSWECQPGAIMQPSLADLTIRFLDRPIAGPDTSDVEPFSVLSNFPVDPRLAWDETWTVVRCLGSDAPAAAMPADWPSTIRQQPAVRFLPMAYGCYPQMVSDLSIFFASNTGQTKSFSIPTTPNMPPLRDEYARNNQLAANQWAAGNHQDALAIWQALGESPVKSFNLGLAYLANGQFAAAKAQLKEASSQLPSSSGWSALADFYRHLAQAKD